MSLGKEERIYQQSLVQGASPAGVVIVLYDRLVGDLQRAMEATAGGDIERRCAEIKHAFLVLEQLEGSLNFENGGPTAQQLSRFYSHLRGKIFEANFKGSKELLQTQITLILSVREAWQELEMQNQQVQAAAVAIPKAITHLEEREAFSCTG